MSITTSITSDLAATIRLW